MGPSIARDLRALGIARVAQLRGRSPERLYERRNRQTGVRQDRCLLYVFRCAVYFASTKRHETRLLKWWNWSDARIGPSGKRPIRPRGSAVGPPGNPKAGPRP